MTVPIHKKVCFIFKIYFGFDRANMVLSLTFFSTLACFRKIPLYSDLNKRAVIEGNF